MLYLRLHGQQTNGMITNIDQLDLQRRYTYADYLTWQFQEAVELIRGKVFRMSPAPNLGHQRVSSRLHGLLFSYVDGLHGSCEVFHASFDVRLPLPPHMATDDQIDTVVQPDLCVICDPSKLDAKGCIGAPDWVIEILSPGTSHKDFQEKFEVYEHAGVQEYWIVHPHDDTLLTYQLDDTGTYQGRQKPYLPGDKVPVSVFPAWEVELGRVFPRERNS